MEEFTVKVGSIERGNNTTADNMRPVTFTAEKLAERTVPHTGDTRGSTYTLYRTEDGRLIVHDYYWTRWEGEVSTSHLELVTEDDLDVDGRHELLGREAGFARDLTLDEALRDAPE